jgi:hypothetical protein
LLRASYISLGAEDETRKRCLTPVEASLSDATPSTFNWLVTFLLQGLSLAEAKLAELERKVDVIMKGLNLLLFGEGEVLPEDEIRDLKERLEDYVTGRSSEFVKLDELQ